MKHRLLVLQMATPVLAILFGMLSASVIILAIGRNPLDVYAVMVRFNLTRTDSLFSILFKTTPLIFAGLAVALSFRVSLFNIGVEGQYYIGAFCAALVGFSLRGLPAVLHLPLALLAAAGGAMVWALVPIVLKLRRGAHEVITTIMMNYIASALLLYLINDVFATPHRSERRASAPRWWRLRRACPPWARCWPRWDCTGPMWRNSISSCRWASSSR